MQLQVRTREGDLTNRIRVAPFFFLFFFFFVIGWINIQI